MANVASLQAISKAPARAATATASRLFFVDHWRVALAILVVLFRARRSIDVQQLDVLKG